MLAVVFHLPSALNLSFGIQHSNGKTKCILLISLCYALLGATAKLLLIRGDVTTRCPRSILLLYVWKTTRLLRGEALRVAISEHAVETRKRQNSTAHSGRGGVQYGVSLQHLDNGITTKH